MAILTVVDENGQAVDLNAVAAWDGESSMLPPGNYTFEITGVEQGMSSSAQPKPQLTLDLQVVAAEGSDQYNGAKCKHRVPLTAKAAGRCKNLLDAVGLNPEGLDDQALIGCQFNAEVIENQYTKMDPVLGEQVKTNTKIQKESPAGPFGVEAAAAPESAPAADPAPAAAPTAAAAPAQRPAAPAQRQAAPAQAQRPAAPAQRTLPRPGTQPRVATGNPGRR